MEGCSNCLYDTRHPFGLVVDNDSCSGCDTHREKYTIDWDQKKNELEDVALWAKKKSLTYDCVVPVTGDAEDYFVLNKVLGLGLNPLVVSVNDYFKNDIGWYNLHQLITYFDVDSMVYNPDVRVYKDLVRTSLRKFDHILLPFLTLHTSFPVHVAKQRKIPLIVWGQNQSIEQVGKFSHYDKVEMTEWSRNEHDLFSCNIDYLIGSGAQVGDRDLNYYKYPKIASLYNKGIRGIYLSNYYKWDPLKQNRSTLKFGYKPQKNHSSFDIYERAGSSVYYQMHDLLRHKRIGYRKIKDHLVREIRHGRIDKLSAIKVEEEFSKSGFDVYPFFNWLDMSKSGMKWFIKHRLSNYEHLLSNDNAQNINLPKDISKYLISGSAPNKEFITFGKGIQL
jgi:N-acetyl sugar amidotransferase